MRCKFRLDEIKRATGSVADGIDPATGRMKYRQGEVQSLAFSPVYHGNDPEHENAKFWSATPGGRITLDVVNQAAVAGLQLGAEYYVDITQAPAKA